MSPSPRRSSRSSKAHSERADVVKNTALLPSPSPSDSFKEQPLQHDQGCANLDSIVGQQDEDNLADGEPSQPRTGKRSLEEDSEARPSRKRHRSGTSAEPTKELLEDPHARGDLQLNSDHSPAAVPEEILPASVLCGAGEQDDGPPIAHWANTGFWPKDFATMAEERDPVKRPVQSTSYTERVRNGEVPRAYTAGYEKQIAQHGIIMDEVQGKEFLTEAGKSTCEQMLSTSYDDPEYTPFPLSQFLSVWNRFRNRNEYRIFRDITPMLVPSAEILYFCGHRDLEHIVEEFGADWKKSNPMGGPAPRPDFAAGLAYTAFTDEEIVKLAKYSAFNRAALFTDNMYFPFLLCETKSGDQSINRADRQNAQSSGVAVNAIVQLHRVLGDAEVSQLSGQILAFSISHDNERAKVYAHYAVVEGATEKFYRCFLNSFDFILHGERKRTYDFVRAVYHIFYPLHLKRIRDALSKMEDQPNVSIASSEITSESASQEPSAGIFKVPGEPASKRQRIEAALLREQLAERERWYQEQMALYETRFGEQLVQEKARYEEQLAEAKQATTEAKELMALQGRQNEELMAGQERRHKEQMEMLKQLLNRK